MKMENLEFEVLDEGREVTEVANSCCTVTAAAKIK